MVKRSGKPGYYSAQPVVMIKEEKKLVEEADHVSSKKRETYEWKINQRAKNKIPYSIRAQLASLNNFKLRAKHHRILGKPDIIKMYPANSPKKKTISKH